MKFKAKNDILAWVDKANLSFMLLRKFIIWLFATTIWHSVCKNAGNTARMVTHVPSLTLGWVSVLKNSRSTPYSSKFISKTDLLKPFVIASNWEDLLKNSL